MYFILQLIEGTLISCTVLENHYLNYLNIYLGKGETIIAAILTALPWWRDWVRAVAWRSLLIRFHIFVIHFNDWDGSIVGHCRGCDSHRGLHKRWIWIAIVYRTGHHGHRRQRIHCGVKMVCKGNVRNIKVLRGKYRCCTQRGNTGDWGVMMLWVGVILVGDKLGVGMLWVAGLDLG